MIYAYCVPHIEVEFGWGSRPEGYQVFLDEKACKERTLRQVDEASEDAKKGECYSGPVIPPYYVKVPIDCLPQDIANEAKGWLMTRDLIPDEKEFYAWSRNYWKPEIKSDRIRIEKE